MAASRSSSNRSGESQISPAGTGAKTKRSDGARRRSKSSSSGRASRSSATVADGLSNLAEQLVNRIIKPLGLVVLSRERIQETLDEAAERGRLTRSDAQEIGRQLVQRGRQQTEDLLADLERLLGRGRQQLDSAARNARLGEPLDRLARRAGLGRRRPAEANSFPIADYDDLTVAQIQGRLDNLAASDLRRIRDYELRHANRKSVLAAVEKLLH